MMGGGSTLTHLALHAIFMGTMDTQLAKGERKNSYIVGHGVDPTAYPGWIKN
jgi:hypothetical protein